MALILLRDQPGVETLSYWVEQAGGWLDRYEEMAHDLAEQLFGISEYDIEHIEDDQFPVLRMMRDESDEYWAKHGWDVTDGKGKQLIVMDVLIRPMVCAVEGLHPDARINHSADAWGAQLEEEAKRFRPSR